VGVLDALISPGKKKSERFTMYPRLANQIWAEDPVVSGMVCAHKWSKWEGSEAQQGIQQAFGKYKNKTSDIDKNYSQTDYTKSMCICKRNISLTIFFSILLCSHLQSLYHVTVILASTSQ
jgi:hypothetical protein